MRRVVVGVAIVALAAGCSTAGSTRRVEMMAQPSDGLQDSSITVSVRGLAPGATATITASARDAKGVAWSASARFAASSTGTLDSSDPSLGGSYTGRDPMGLFDLMTPSGSSSTRASAFISPLSGYPVTLETTVDGRPVAKVTTRRDSGAADVVKRALRPASDGVYGELDLPRHSSGRKPAMLLFGGSGGGLETGFAAERLAARGYPALALAYFGEPGLPSSLNLIPLEYFVTALRLLRALPGVDPDHVLVFGDSRGSEAALLLGADFPDLVNGVVAGVPSSVVNVGYPDSSTAAWTLHGRPLPTAPVGSFSSTTPPDSAASIPVERIRGPIVTVCGTDDLVWTSCAYAAAIANRLHAHRSRYPLLALRYPGAGHLVGTLDCCYSVTAPAFASYGGSAIANQGGRRDVWTHVLTLLATQ